MTVAPSSDSNPVVEPRSINAFCGIIFGRLEGFVPVRLLAEAGTPDQKPRLEFPEATRIADCLIRVATRAAAQQRGVFVVPGTVLTPGSAKAKDIAQTGVILVDLDHDDISAKVNHLIDYLGPPSLEVASGGTTDEGHDKMHLYWRLTEAAVGADAVRVAGLRGEIAAKVGGDPAFASLHQPIRVAGTVHGKNGRQASVRLLTQSTNEYDLAELEEAVHGMPPMADVASSADKHGPPRRGLAPRDLATKKIAAGGQDGETRFLALSKVIGHWIRTARTGLCTIDEAWTAVQEHNAAMIVPPWDEVRLRHEFEALLARDTADKGPLPDFDGKKNPGRNSAPTAPPLSDDAIASDFVVRHATHWKCSSAWGVWHRWDGDVWEQDETGMVRELARRICRSAAQLATSPSQARQIASEKKMAAVLRVAAADPDIAVSPPQWDAHPMLLNTPAGVVDLDTGAIRAHDPGLLFTQMTTASPGRDCPRWTSFLNEITDGDAELQAYLARLAGYCLTGSTKEQTFAFLHGHGANGKSVFLQTLASIMGSYAATAAQDTFMASRADRHLTELAGLRAARLVLVSETEAGRSWAEARIKAVTGGEKLRANFMRRDHFEFTPQFKLLVAGNHRPTLNAVGEAMRRRLHLVPFTVTIPTDRRDPGLAEKLLAERDGILGWMLAGCAAWQREGLAPPPSVMAAADDYFEAEDLVGQWIDECCVGGKEQKAPSAQLFQSWKSWAEDRGFPPGSQKVLGEALRGRGFSPTTVGRSRGWTGIGLRSGPSSVEGET